MPDLSAPAKSLVSVLRDFGIEMGRRQKREALALSLEAQGVTANDVYKVAMHFEQGASSPTSAANQLFKALTAPHFLDFVDDVKAMQKARDQRRQRNNPVACNYEAVNESRISQESDAKRAMARCKAARLAAKDFLDNPPEEKNRSEHINYLAESYGCWPGEIDVALDMAKDPKYVERYLTEDAK